MPFLTAKKIKNLIFLGEEQKLSCIFLSFCSLQNGQMPRRAPVGPCGPQKFVCRSAGPILPQLIQTTLACWHSTHNVVNVLEHCHWLGAMFCGMWDPPVNQWLAFPFKQSQNTALNVFFSVFFCFNEVPSDSWWKL